ncbi:DUF3099 domain-containing protein [Aeromicrobium alkaliterrae]|uniref:DUF3099 domain-containing protein n=1 Tax=Aeromicrobium alkaliterrae TaxID=302168 RepID=A0ABN2JKX9_9ACTN
MNKRDDEVQVITSASAPASQGLTAKERRYAFSMALRTVCFLGACIADGWLRWTLVVGAVFLPYVSVVLANAGVRSGPARGSDFVPMEHRAIAARPERDEI